MKNTKTETVSILLAEDDRNLGNLLKEYLETKGYDTRLAVNGKEAYDLFSKNKFDWNHLIARLSGRMHNEYRFC